MGLRGSFARVLLALWGRVARTLRPSPAARALRLETLGTDYGSWTIPVERVRRDWICYAAGVGEDVSFDCALIERFGCHVFAFDPTPRAIAHVSELRRRVLDGEPMTPAGDDRSPYPLSRERLDHLHLLPVGVWSENEDVRFYAPQDPDHVSHSITNLQGTTDFFVAECVTIGSLMERLGHDRIDLLKLDVEGAEYEVLRSMRRDGIRPLVLCVEFDEGPRPLDCGALRRILQAVRTLREDGYTLVSREGWNCSFVRLDSASAGP